MCDLKRSCVDRGRKSDSGQGLTPGDRVQLCAKTLRHHLALPESLLGETSLRCEKERSLKRADGARGLGSWDNMGELGGRCNILKSKCKFGKNLHHTKRVGKFAHMRVPLCVLIHSGIFRNMFSHPPRGWLEHPDKDC